MTNPKHIAFQSAYQACHEPFLKYCSALAFGKMDVQDLVQDVLLSTYQNFDSIQNKDLLLHYLIKAARNRFININRKAQRQIALKDKHTERMEANGVQADVILDIQFMYQMLNRLPNQQKEALILFEISGFSIKEIAALQGKREGAIKTTLSRGRKKLQLLFSEEETTQKKPFWAFLFLTNSSNLSNMKNEYSELFDVLKNIPTELSATETNQLITGIASTSLPLNEIGQKSNFLNLNSFIMTSSIFSFLTVLSVLLSVSTTSPNKIAFAPVVPTSSIEVEDGVPIAAPIKAQIDTTIDALSTRTKQRSLAILPGKNDKISTSQSNPLNEIELPKPVPQYQLSTAQTLSDCDAKPTFNTNLEQFGKELLNKLKNDGLITNKSEPVRFSFLEDNLFLNGNLLKGTNQSDYSNYLKTVGVKPCPRRIVDVTPLYVAIGDLTDEGFIGESFGNIESMDLDQYVLKGNFSENAKRKIDRYLSTSEKETRIVKPFSAISIEGNVEIVYHMGISDKVQIENNGISSGDIIIKNKKKTLEITVKGNKNGKKAIIYLRATQLRALALSEGAIFTGKDYIQSTSLAITMNGDSVADIQVDLDSFVANVNGARLNVSGKCKTYVSNSQNNGEGQGIFDTDLKHESHTKR